MGGLPDLFARWQMTSCDRGLLLLVIAHGRFTLIPKSRRANEPFAEECGYFGCLGAFP